MAESVGKLVAGRRYFHTSLIGTLDAATSLMVERAAAITGVRTGFDFNVVRIDSLDDSVAFLSYPGFFDEACPPLARSWKVSTKDQRATLRSYQDSLNPPVLHRKELLLEGNDPHRPTRQDRAQLRKIFLLKANAFWFPALIP